MPLVKCKECQNEISDKAYDCPNCGNPIKRPKRTGWGKFFKLSFFFFNIILVIWLIIPFLKINESNREAASDELIVFHIISTTATWLIGSLVIGVLVLMTRPKK